MGRRDYDYDDRYEKLYDMIELMYILNGLSNNSYIDDSSKKYLVGMLENVESIKSNYDKYREEEPHVGRPKTIRYRGSSGYSSNNNSVIDKVIFFLKSLND